MYSTQVDAVSSGLSCAAHSRPQAAEELEAFPQLNIIGHDTSAGCK